MIENKKPAEPGLRGRYGRFRVMKTEDFGYRLEVKLQRPIAGQEWGTIETYDFLANARHVARALRMASNWPAMLPN